jgi:hypothetical protein
MKPKLKLFPVNRDNVFKAIVYTMLLSATAHLLGSLYLAMRDGNPDIANMFNIIGLGLIFPQLSTGALNSLLGILFVIAIGVWFYAMQQWHDQHPNSRKRPW